MDRAEALSYIQAMMDSLSTAAGRETGDTMAGYRAALDSAFAQYITKNGLTTTTTTTDVPGVDAASFMALLEAVTYDLLLPSLAIALVDVSVDAPLTGIKQSQSVRNLQRMQEAAWARAGAFGWGHMDNVGGFKVNFDILEPGDSNQEYA
jgi:hypothetical protein